MEKPCVCKYGCGWVWMCTYIYINTGVITLKMTCLSIYDKRIESQKKQTPINIPQA